MSLVRRFVASRFVATAVAVAAACGLSSCGSSDLAPTGTPTPSSTPAVTEPTTLAFVHVVGDDAISSYTVVPATGLLAPASRQPLEGGRPHVVADPKGRFLFVDFQVAAAAGSTDTPTALLRSYAIDPTTGALTLAKQTSGVLGNAVATPRALFSSYQDPWGDRRLAVRVVEQDGSLKYGYPHWEPVLSSFPAGDILFADPKADRFLVSSPDVNAGFSAWDVGTITKWRGVWVGMVYAGGYRDESKTFAEALVADGIVVLVSARGEITSFEPYSGEGHVAEKASASGPGSLLAYAKGILAAGGDSVVETYALGPHGGLTPLTTTTLPSSTLRSLALHPSGRFLYVSGQALSTRALRTYLVEGDGSLRAFGDELPVAGEIVVTTPARD
jgi:6-phosphogluconolactonase (cycloisomerase 2 family)